MYTQWLKEWPLQGLHRMSIKGVSFRPAFQDLIGTSALLFVPRPRFHFNNKFKDKWKKQRH